MSGRTDDSQFMGAFGLLVNAMGGGGDAGQAFPNSDAVDFQDGARFIPGEVTLSRRAGKRVTFHRDCRNGTCWYWEMPDGSRVYHYDHDDAIAIGRSNHGGDFGSSGDYTNPGPCPSCGNPFTNGETITVEQIQKSH